jgi:hypothetical protein
MRHSREMYNLYTNVRSELIDELDTVYGIFLQTILNDENAEAITNVKRGINSYKYHIDVACQYYYLACFDCRDRSKRIKIGDGK